MSNSVATPGVAAGRLPASVYEENFADLRPPLTAHEASVAADRGYFCHDAPCVAACPTAIDIPLFVRQISTGTARAAAKTIFDRNILGGMCARACPTETVCEQACVREAAEGKPVEIGRLQRFATDALMARGGHPYARAAPTGKRIAVVGPGPRGWRAPIDWCSRDTPSSSSMHAPRRAASTSSASPATRPSIASRSGR